MKERMHPRHIAIVACCCLTSGIPAGMLMNTPGIFYPVVADDLGVQTAAISAWMAICLLSAAVFQPLMGNIVSRFRMRAFMLAGALVQAVVFVVFSQATAPWMFWAAAVFTGIPFATCLSVGPATLVNRWFEKHVGAIMGLLAASSAVGGVVFMLIGQAIIETAGWRAAYLVYAAVIVVVAVPAILLCVRDHPRECGLAPFGVQAPEPPESAAGRITPGIPTTAPNPEAVSTLPGQRASEEVQDAAPGDAPALNRLARACMRTPAFWLLLVAGFLMNMVCQVNGYLPKYVYWVEEQAALGLMPAAFVAGVVLSSLTQAGSAIGKFVLGVFSDFSVRKALVALCLAGAVGIACVWALPSTPLVAVGGLVYGFFLAAILVLVPMLTRAIFGAGELYPIMYARVAVAPAIGGAAANIVWPFIADNAGGFDMVFGIALVMIAVVVACGLAALRLAPKR